jgi:hypothetical protein
MRHHNPLCRHEENTKHLTDARETTRIDLADIYRLCLEQLLKHHPIVRVFARRDANSMCLERAPDRGVPQYIIRSSGLLDEPTITRRK